MNKINTISLFSTPSYLKKENPTINTEQNKEENEQIINNELNHIALLNKSQINFRSAIFNWNKKDLLFISSIISSLGLSAIHSDKLKTVISEYLKENNFSSMGDFGGEKHIKEQSELQSRISKVLNIEKDHNKMVFLANRIIERCDEGESYFPSSQTLEESIAENEKLSKFFTENLKKSIIKEQKADAEFINAISYSLELNEKEKETLIRIINDTLNENNLISLSDFLDKNLLETQAVMQEKIYKELKIPQEQELILDMELENRIFSGYKYRPITNPIDKNTKTMNRDIPILNQIINNYSLSLKDKNALLFALKEDTYQNNYKSIFDLFKQGNNINKYKNLNLLLKNKSFEEIKYDLLIDLTLAGKDIDASEQKIRDKEVENRIKYGKTTAAIYLMDKEFNFSKEQIKSLKNYLFTEKLDNEKNIWKAAYEIANEFNLNANAENKIVDIIKTISTATPDDISKYEFKYTQLLIKKSNT